ncbi:helix-turn-helix domain-containing protein [Paenibacillus rhizovicinus]|uniref:Helix-turn-helix domain-containing protein n=1 Tax=Paenibacillus rhizovicinus TaxID=2704463 RepID=A0A6C0NXI3_9BACL|nr:XRE family transcriptional regulator [Paenibacillus rhizovicinus]QHW30955.1 helix-turn-helix domain-containing protein [Paenibacillus rhizovicinus]
MEQIHIKLGKNLKAVRQTRGLSLDKVSELTGVSKAMLGQIERGETSPTISTIWKIANGLRLSFTSLIEKPPGEVAVVAKQDIEPLLEEDGKFRSYPMFPFDPSKKFEAYAVEMDQGSTHASEAHSPGVEEYVLVSFGTLVVDIQNTSYHVNEGDAVRFAADQPHIYRNAGEGLLRYNAIIYYP